VRLRRLDIRRLPGIDEPFAVESFAPGVNVVLGPNASGKSSLCRAVRATLWPGEERADAEVRSEWEEGDVRLFAERATAVRWQRDGADVPPPPLPEPHLAHCYTLGLRDLLDAASENDQKLAERIRVQMAGGYDLRAVAASFALRRNHARSEERALREAQRVLRQLAAERRELARESDALESLRREGEEAREAGRAAERLRRAAELAECREAIAALDAQLARLAPELARLRGDEVARLDALADEIEALSAQEEELARRIDAARAERDGAGLADGPCDETQLATWIARTRALGATETARAEAERRVAASRAVWEKARNALGAPADSGDVGPVVVAATDLDDLESWLDAAQRLRERGRELEARAGATEERAAGAEDLRRGADALRDWLLDSPSARFAALPVWLLVAVGLAGAAGAWLVHPVAAALLALPLGALVEALAARARGRRERARAEHRFRDAALEPPAAWRADGVRRRLLEIEDSLLDVREREHRAREGEAARAALAALAAEEQALDTRRRELQQRVGADPAAGDLRLAELARRLEAERSADRALVESEAERDARRAQEESELAALGRFLRATSGAAPRDAAEALAHLEDLRERGARWREAEVRRAALEGELERRAADLHRRQQERAALLRECGLGDLHQEAARKTLEGWLAELPLQRDLGDQRRDRERRAAALEAGLADRPALVALSRDEALAQLADALHRAERGEEVARRIGGIEARVREAEGRSVLEEAMAEVASAQSALAERREESLAAEASAFLLEDVEREYEERSRPEVLDRAMRWFARFTYHSWELRVDESGAFRALETATGRGRSLGELSDGTRMQLLLAARLAFATQAESGARLPLFLDEALTASDERRFRAVAESLYTLADEGRQVVYLTCNPADVGTWNWVADELGRAHPHLIQLGEERRRASAAGAAELRAPDPIDVPAPDGLTPEEYGARLGVPLPDPFGPADALHLFHLLRDDLPLLHRLLSEARIESAGHWRSLVRHDGAGPFTSEAERRHLDALVELAAAWAEAWREGRGRPVDRAALAASGAVSDAFLDRVAELAEELGGDARRLLEALEAGRAKRFHADKRESLAAWLEEQGYLDPRPVLDAAAVRARVAARLRAHTEAGALSPEEVFRRVDALTRAARTPRR
jgi:exonuclease SbcC